MSSNIARHLNIEVQNVIVAYKYRQLEAAKYSMMGPLLTNIAAGAMHNSAERSGAPKCYPGTRVAVQKEIVAWVEVDSAENTGLNMMWVTGPAGTGKTAILGSIAETFQEKGWLAASFFFSSSGSHGRRTKRALIATLAYQLLKSPIFQDVTGPQILKSIENNPAIFQERLQDQLEELILKPLRKTPRGAADTWPKVVLIDSLDECSSEDGPRQGEDDQSEILHTLLIAANDPAFPFRIIVVSRPEWCIRSFFEHIAKDTTYTIFLDEKYEPDADIALFLKSRFADIGRRYAIPPELWIPRTEEATTILVKNASGQFIYVSTAMRFIELPSKKSPTELLDCVLEPGLADEANPFAPLDALYTFVLNSSPDPTLSVKWIITMQSIIMPARFIQQFLETSPGRAGQLLGNLHSLLLVPPQDNATARYGFYHKSLMDFLDDPNRSRDLHVDVENRELFFIDNYVRVLKNQGPSVRLTSNYALSVFHDHFTSLIPVILNPNDYTHFSALEQDLANCDADWWAQKFIEHMSKDHAKRQLQVIFQDVHVWCRWYGCRPLCRHWREGILQRCTDAGWELPSTFTLLWDRVSPCAANYLNVRT